MTDPRAPVITIDGPTASGKGTVASRVAAALGFHLLDSGALYRLVALDALNREVPHDAVDTLVDLASGMDIRFADGKILLAGKVVTDAIRAEAVGNTASRIARHGPLRQALLARQRDFCQPPGLVADGRDMGTVVFPDAELKVYLTASVQARAERRYKQLIDKGFSATLSALFEDLEQRDARDINRAESPLKPAEGARILDSSTKTVDESVKQVLDWWSERQQKK
ncbi:cytidylate kinase CmK [soil metagenome]